MARPPFSVEGKFSQKLMMGKKRLKFKYLLILNRVHGNTKVILRRVNWTELLPGGGPLKNREHELHLARASQSGSTEKLTR
jgi:hypothetical protein